VANRADKRPLLLILALIAAAAAVYFGFVYGHGHGFEAGTKSTGPNLFAILALVSLLFFFMFIIWFVVALAGRVSRLLSGTTVTRLLVKAAAILVSIPVAGYLTFFLWAASPLYGCPFYELVQKDQAFELSKEFILKHRMEELGQYGVDASIFEHSEARKFTSTCNRPPRYHYAALAEDGGFHVAWVTYLKGGCDDCWERLMVSATVGPCGSIASFRISHEDKMFSPSAKKDVPLCPPAYWPPGAKPESANPEHEAKP